jgi:hypothetical protein
LSEELQQALVEIQFAEDVELGDPLDRTYLFFPSPSSKARVFWCRSSRPSEKM